MDSFVLNEKKVKKRNFFQNIWIETRFRSWAFPIFFFLPPTLNHHYSLFYSPTLEPLPAGIVACCPLPWTLEPRCKNHPPLSIPHPLAPTTSPLCLHLPYPTFFDTDCRIFPSHFPIILLSTAQAHFPLFNCPHNRPLPRIPDISTNFGNIPPHILNRFLLLFFIPSSPLSTADSPHGKHCEFLYFSVECLNICEMGLLFYFLCLILYVSIQR